MKKIQIAVLLILGTTTVHGQVSFTKDFRNNDIIEVSINNLIRIIEMPSSDFDQSMKSKGYNLSVKNDCNNYVKGSSLDGTIHEVSKCARYLVTVGWFSLDRGRTSIKAFKDDIERYYAGFDREMEMSFYQVKRNNSVYNFYILADNSSENVFCKKMN
jgi:hypothetical protein